MKNAVILRLVKKFDIELAVEIDPLKRLEIIENAARKGECFFVMADGQTVGLAILSHAFFGRDFIELIEIKENFKRKGYGSSAIIELLKNCKTDRVFTSTNESNKPMQGLLKKLGFIYAGTVDGLDEGDLERFYYKDIKNHEVSK